MRRRERESSADIDELFSDALLNSSSAVWLVWEDLRCHFHDVIGKENDGG